MSKDVDVSKAKEWDDDEAMLNIAYLRSRSRDDLAEQVIAARGSDPTPPPEEPVGSDQGTVGVDRLPDGFENYSVNDVLEWVGEDQVRAGLAYAAELERDNPRKGVVEVLEPEE